MATGRTIGKLIVSSGGIYEISPLDEDGYPERPIAMMYRFPHPKTGAFVRPPTESDANAHHLVECWNAIEELGGDPREIVKRYREMEKKNPIEQTISTCEYCGVPRGNKHQLAGLLPCPNRGIY